jgi:hypothetical protein
MQTGVVNNRVSLDFIRISATIASSNPGGIYAVRYSPTIGQISGKLKLQPASADRF